MKKFLEYAGLVLIVEGAAGLVYHFVGWFRLWTVVHYLDFLSGFEIAANVVLIVLGIVVLVVSDRVTPAE